MSNIEENSYHKINLNWYPGHMAKTKREIEEDLKLIDVVVEIIDSRIPISSRNPDIEKLTESKDKIIVLNEGKCVGIGKHKDLLKTCEVYRQIALSQLSKEELENA